MEAPPRSQIPLTAHSGLDIDSLSRMSLAIREQEVVAVLLADGWHEVKPRSFFIDAYEYIHDDGSLSAGGVGFGFHAEDLERGELAGPLSSILAVTIRR
jgi:hypothetical protein